MSPEAAFKLWKPLYIHFTSLKYDCIESGERIKLTEKEIEKKSNRFYRFSKLFQNRNEAAYFLISNFIAGEFSAAFNVKEENLDIYYKWKGRRESITYLFKKEFSAIIQKYKDADFDCKYPHESGLFNDYIAGEICPETMILLDKYYKNFLDKWLINESVNVFYDSILRLVKYKKFVRHNREKIEGVINSVKK